MYASRPPWDIGRPQPAFVRLEDEGAIRGDVLDAGCGTGENALFFASRGHPTLGVDGAPTAIAMAREKAKAKRIEVEFIVHDALRLGDLGRMFDTVVDSGLFHTFEDGERSLYAASVRTALRPGGVLQVMCFSEHEPGDWGPRRVTQADIRAAFSDGWRVERIIGSGFEANVAGADGAGARAWLATIRKT